MLFFLDTEKKKEYKHRSHRNCDTQHIHRYNFGQLVEMNLVGWIQKQNSIGKKKHVCFIPKKKRLCLSNRNHKIEFIPKLNIVCWHSAGRNSTKYKNSRRYAQSHNRKIEQSNKLNKKPFN